MLKEERARYQGDRCGLLAGNRGEGIERQLLNAELALFEAVQERIAESDSLVRNLAAGDPRVRWVRTIPGFGRGG